MRTSFAAAFVLVLAPALLGQTTGTLTGVVSSGETPVPGVTITITSPALQGERVTTSGGAGTFQFSALPPGDYTVKYEREGMDSVTLTTRLSLSHTARAELTGISLLGS